MDNRLKPRFPRLGEFDFIERLLSVPGTPDFPGNLQANDGWMGPGDDCALLGDWLISTDLSVEGTHFRLDWAKLPSIIEKCVLSNLSDINAKGGITGFVLLNLCLRRSWNAQIRAQVADVFAEVLSRYKVEILGGDTVVGDLASFGLTVFGKCPSGKKPLLRANAMPGHYVYVTGHLGASAAGLWALMHNRTDSGWEKMIHCHHNPVPPLGLGAELLRLGVEGAAIDISDGLSSELHHICIQSGVGIRIEDDLIPRAEGLIELCEGANIDPAQFYLHGGEEYQLIFTSSMPPSLLVLELKPFEVSWIGMVVPEVGVTLVKANGEKLEMLPGAWSHI